MHDSSWHPECIEDELFIAFVQIKRALHNASAGADPGTIPVLHQLAVDGPSRQSQVATALGLDASTISRHVRSLLRDELIEAGPDPDDRRAMRLSLTQRGAGLLRESLDRRRTELQAATSDFSPEERAELIRLLNKCTANMTQRHPAAARP